ncbi:Uncharacterised protein [Mycobacterium tuberculosis]|nr:Uncharacterised protein [Mycobacterium tuberculosis]
MLGPLIKALPEHNPDMSGRHRRTGDGPRAAWEEPGSSSGSHISRRSRVSSGTSAMRVSLSCLLQRKPLVVGADDPPHSDVGKVTLCEFVVGIVVEDY